MNNFRPRPDVVMHMIGLAALGFAVTGLLFVLMTGCTSVDLAARHGLPKGYRTPFVVVDGTGEQVCVLYPDGHLDMKAPPEFVIRILIVQLKGLQGGYQAELAKAKRETATVEAELAKQSKESQALQKKAADKDD